MCRRGNKLIFELFMCNIHVYEWIYMYSINILHTYLLFTFVNIIYIHHCYYHNDIYDKLFFLSKYLAKISRKFYNQRTNYSPELVYCHINNVHMFVLLVPHKSHYSYLGLIICLGGTLINKIFIHSIYILFSIIHHSWSAIYNYYSYKLFFRFSPPYFNISVHHQHIYIW